MTCKKACLALILALLFWGGLPQSVSASGTQEVQLQLTITSEEWAAYHESKDSTEIEEPKVEEPGETVESEEEAKNSAQNPSNPAQNSALKTDSSDKKSSLPQTGAEKGLYAGVFLGKVLLLLGVGGLLWRRKRQIK